jgi:SlyX protein
MGDKDFMRTMLPETHPQAALKWPPAAKHPEQRMSEQRLVEIESKLTFQEDLIEELNKTIYQQQQQIERLQAICEALARQVRSLGESSKDGAPANERPPHY